LIREKICGPQLAGKLDSKKMGDLTVDDLVRQSIYDGILLVKDIAEDIWNKVFFYVLGNFGFSDITNTGFSQ